MDTIAIVAAHADDEVLGCGGTIAKLTQKGYSVHVLFLADGETSRGSTANLSDRIEAAKAAAVTMGSEIPTFLNFPDNRLDTIAFLDIVKAIEHWLASLSPSVIYTHHAGDLNLDHRLVHQAILTACRPQPQCSIRAIYGFETQSSTEWASSDMSSAFRPTRFVDISSTLETKQAALKCYEAEMRPFPHSRSLQAVEHLARLRGSSVGLEAAEAFHVIREISK